MDVASLITYQVPFPPSNSIQSTRILNDPPLLLEEMGWDAPDSLTGKHWANQGINAAKREEKCDLWHVRSIVTLAARKKGLSAYEAEWEIWSAQQQYETGYWTYNPDVKYVKLARWNINESSIYSDKS